MIQSIFQPCPRCGGIGKLPRGEHLRRMRGGLGMSLQVMAKRLGVSQQYLCDVEHGRRTATVKIMKGYGL